MLWRLKIQERRQGAILNNKADKGRNVRRRALFLTGGLNGN
jgi:hypothetical protein